MNSREYQQPSSPPPPYYPTVNDNQQKHRSDSSSNQNYSESRQEHIPEFDEFINRYEINPSFAEKLYGLRGYEIVFICDDSGSMSAPVGEVTNPREKQRTRWDELKQTVSIVVDLASILDPDGVDVYFLNREPMLHVHIHLFFSCSTPIVPVLRQVLKDKRNHIYERKLLILIATDGIPTDDKERTDIHTLEHVLKNERTPTNQIPVTIIACTDDEQCIGYLNDWDKKIPNLDVVDDYRTERNEVQAYRGKHLPFSFGDYIVKILMGSIDSWFDNWDEKQ
ncbi:unnamed protein product [Rotaria sp. Silwood2]|nr:unnamed protein product [Rotaria sp. Silwood2]